MSKLHQPHGRADADTSKGELRKPDDYSNQPGQGGAYKGDGGTADDGDDAAPSPMPPPVGESSREYGHSSGDRNTKDGSDDWQRFEGGVQRDATPRAPDDAKARRSTGRDAKDPGGGDA